MSELITDLKTILDAAKENGMDAIEAWRERAISELTEKAQQTAQAVLDYRDSREDALQKIYTRIADIAERKENLLETIEENKKELARHTVSGDFRKYQKVQQTIQEAEEQVSFCDSQIETLYQADIEGDPELYRAAEEKQYELKELADELNAETGRIAVFAREQGNAYHRLSESLINRIRPFGQPDNNTGFSYIAGEGRTVRADPPEEETKSDPPISNNARIYHETVSYETARTAKERKAIAQAVANAGKGTHYKVPVSD